MSITRRGLISGALGAAMPFTYRDETLDHLARLPFGSAHPDDESFWVRLRDAFDIDPNLTMFNHAGLSPSPRTVREFTESASKAANTGPSYVIWRKQERELQPIRDRLAALVGCASDELALTPNCTYGLQTAIMGVPLERGDELLATSHDYPRTWTAISQRPRRDGAVPVEIPLKTPPEPRAEVAKRITDRVTARTRLVVLSQMTLYSGALLPVREVAKTLRGWGVPMLVDAAHRIGLLPDKLEDVHAPFYTACLHKWIMGPVGIGVFVIKRPWIKRIWPLHPADESLDDDIRKFEQIGTHTAAPYLAIREALDFHDMLGQSRKAARLEVLRKRLAERILNTPGVRLRESGPERVPSRLDRWIPEVPVRGPCRVAIREASNPRDHYDSGRLRRDSHLAQRLHNLRRGGSPRGDTAFGGAKRNRLTCRADSQQFRGVSR